MVHPNRLLRWLYLGRLTLAAGIFGGALLVWPSMQPSITLLATLALLLAIAITLPSAWHTHLKRREPSTDFLYVQVLFDALLVTAVVHLTGGSESDFAPLYIAVIAMAALLLPFPGVVLVGAAASMFYVADIIWGHGAIPPDTVFVQLGLFAVMAVVTGYLGDRLRRTGTALGAVESELEQLRLDTSEILDAIDSGVIMVDGEGRLVYMNRAGAALLGLDAGTFLERPILEELDRRVPGLGAQIAGAAETRTPFRLYDIEDDAAANDAALVRPHTEADGGPRAIAVRTAVLQRREGDAPWVSAVIQDVTDARRVEELNRRTARLQAVAALAASLAHEIRNPLASIRSAVEQLAGGRLEGGDRELLERLVLNESDRLSRLLSEFIEYSWVQMRQRTTVDLVAIVADAIGVARQHPDGADGATIEFQPPPAPIEMEGDADLLHRAIFNLVLNGAQFAGPEGVVRVELRRVRRSEVPAGLRPAPWIRLRVTDTGPGIPIDDLPRLFDPFFTTREGGSGLGLALVHRAVDVHDGAVFVDARPGRGARFTLYLPAAAGQNA